MIVRVAAVVCVLVVAGRCQEEAEHREFQYNSVVDPATGRYNFAYDTGHDKDIAHSLHMQYQDADGVVRGRYGYTDPNGKLRMVEYEAGPNGFVARGDVGPDQFPHSQAPLPNAGQDASSDYSDGRSGGAVVSADDVDVDPAPVQMSGWDPEQQPMDARAGADPDAMAMYGPQLGFYPRPADAEQQEVGSRNVESEALRSPSADVRPVLGNNDVDVYNIDVDPDDIRARESGSEGGPVRRSADLRMSKPITYVQQEHVDIAPVPIVQKSVKNKPVTVVREAIKKPVPVVVHQEIKTRPIAVVSAKSEKVKETQYAPVRVRYYPSKYTHDHDSEVRYYRYYRPRQTHDHDAEARYYRYYRPRQTHDHDAEKTTYYRYYRPRQTHDHDAEKTTYYRYYRPRQTHDHDAEKTTYYSNGRYSHPQRIWYRDSHSQEPHEHVDPAYRNHGHYHYRNYEVPATAKPGQLQYIPSDKYHDKEYYWTTSS